MEYRSEMQAPVLGKDKISGCREYNNSLRFMPWRSTELVVGHRYLNQHSLLEDSSQLDLRILQRFSEAWAFSGKWRFPCWTASWTFRNTMCTTIWDPGIWAWGLSFARTGTKTNSGWASALPSSRPEIICRSNSFDVRKGHGFLRGFSRKLFPFSEDSRFENGFCPVRGVVPERERYVAGRQEAESLRLEGWRAACSRRAGQEERRKGKEPLPRLCRNLGLHSGRETGKMPRHGASCGGKPSGFLHE